MNDMEIIDSFEKHISEFTGATYGIAVDSGTNAIFLSLLYLKHTKEIKPNDIITIPKKTYISVPMSICNAGLKVKFEENHWIGDYYLEPTRIIDSAVKFKKNMYTKNSLTCISFQYRKSIPIGRGGMVLTDDKKAMEWLKQARHHGKHMGVNKFDDIYEMCGWDMYMTPELATRGMTLFNILENRKTPIGTYVDYPDVSKQMKNGWNE